MRELFELSWMITIRASKIQKEQNPSIAIAIFSENRWPFGMIAPILLSMKMTGISDFTRDIEIAYGSFGIAWRLLDDIRDIGRRYGKWGTLSDISLSP